MSDNYQKRMARKKAHIDKRIEEANIERGIVILITGNGKGKTTSAFGTLCRAVGHGQKAEAAQFIKGTWACGERNLLEAQGVPFYVMSSGFTWNTQDKAYDTEMAQKVWKQAKPALSNPEVDIVMLDEITYMLKMGYLDAEEVVSAIENRPSEQTVLLTGRNAPDAFYEIADTVSDVRSVKHAFDSGIKARKGVDW